MTSNEHTELTLKRAYLVLQAHLEGEALILEQAHEAL